MMVWKQYTKNTNVGGNKMAIRYIIKRDKDYVKLSCNAHASDDYTTDVTQATFFKTRKAAKKDIVDCLTENEEEIIKVDVQIREI